MRSALALVAFMSLSGVVRAQPLLLARKDLPTPKLFELQREAAVRGLEIAAPEPRPEPASEAVLADVRPIYRDMNFARCAGRLESGIDNLIRAREPSPGAVRALAELELWRGACRVLAGDARGGREHFALAKQLSPAARPEPIFPPKVKSVFKSVKSEKPTAIEVRLAPAGSHLWIDGKLVETAVKASPGLHYIVVARADLVPEAQLMRLAKGHVIAVSLRERAPVADALRAARWVTPDPQVGAILVGFDNNHFSATPLDASKGSLVEKPSAAELIDAICVAYSGCSEPPKPEAPSPAPFASPAPLIAETPPPPPIPVWKRGWFWGALGGAVAVALGVSLGVGLGVTAPSDYVVRVR
jgi:hypothetical protein